MMAYDGYPPKSQWGDGPWQDEPDRKEWRHGGLPCLARRGPGGQWCGYVAVAPGHPLHGKTYDEVDVNVHGGLTYSGPCDGDEGHGICHVPRQGEPADVHWFGFDCAHCFDFAPATQAVLNRVRGDRVRGDEEARDFYRDLPYVEAEVTRLAEQLAEHG